MGAETGTDNVSLVGIGARMLEVDGLVNEVGIAGKPVDPASLEDTGSVSLGTGSGRGAALLC